MTIQRQIPMRPQKITHLREIVADFEGIFLDQFGVLHDGSKPYAQIMETLTSIKKAGLSCAVISNSGKRSAQNRRRLSTMGFDTHLFDEVLTSGEVGHQRLYDIVSSHTGLSPLRVYLMARDGDRAVLEGLDIASVDAPEDAELIILAGSTPEIHGVEAIAAKLQPAARRGVTCLCLNPDVRMFKDGAEAPGTGLVAHAYEAMGGDVEWIGKPHPMIFRELLQRVEAEDPARFLMIGDSPEHDIAGARAVGMASLFIVSGLYQKESARIEAGDWPTEQMPEYVMDSLIW